MILKQSVFQVQTGQVGKRFRKHSFRLRKNLEVCFVFMRKWGFLLLCYNYRNLGVVRSRGRPGTHAGQSFPAQGGLRFTPVVWGPGRTHALCWAACHPRGRPAGPETPAARFAGAVR